MSETLRQTTTYLEVPPLNQANRLLLISILTPAILQHKARPARANPFERRIHQQTIQRQRAVVLVAQMFRCLRNVLPLGFPAVMLPLLLWC